MAKKGSPGSHAKGQLKKSGHTDSKPFMHNTGKSGGKGKKGC